jgi:RNA polymerase sigma-70 factor (ECF subfamily)
MKLRENQGKIPVELTENHEATPAPSYDMQQTLTDERTYELMETAIGELNSEQKQCVTLFYLEKKSYHEISEKTGFNLMQVKSYIQNGKRNLRIILEKKLKEQDIKR